MNSKDFSNVSAVRINDCMETLGLKAGEYATDEDRLRNFKLAAALERCTPERALLGMWTKHLVSVIDIIEGIDQGKPIDRKLWDEKIGDSINYHLLLNGLVIERLNSNG